MPRDQKSTNSLFLSFPLALAYNRVTRERGVLEYTPRVIYTLRLAIGIDPWGPALSYTLYIRGAFTILAAARAGSGQVLFFIDSFERTFGHAGTLSPVPIFSLPVREDRTDERERKREKVKERKERESARCKIKDGGDLIEIVAIITHSGAAVV